REPHREHPEDPAVPLGLRYGLDPALFDRELTLLGGPRADNDLVNCHPAPPFPCASVGLHRSTSSPRISPLSPEMPAWDRGLEHGPRRPAAPNGRPPVDSRRNRVTVDPHLAGDISHAN